MTDQEREELLELLEKPWDEIKETAERLQPVFEKLGEEMVEAFATVWESIYQAFSVLGDSLQQSLELMAAEAYTPDPPRKKPPRPPRYAGPQNKGREWNRQPKRLARSSCRKMRR